MSHVITQEVDAPTLARAQGRWSGPAAAGASAHDGGESMDVCSCIIAQGAARGRWTASHAPQAHRLPLTGSRKRREHGSCWLVCQRATLLHFSRRPAASPRPPPSFHGTAAGRRVAALVPAASTPPTADREEESLRECREGALFAPLLQATSILALPRSCVPALVL